MRDLDTRILEETYSEMSTNPSDFLISEGVGEEISKAITSIGNIPAYFSSWGQYLEGAAVTGVTVAIASQIIGWLFIGISRVLDRDISAKKEARDAILNIRYSNEVKKMSQDDSLSTEEMYDAYMNIKDKLAMELDEKYPLVGKVKWALVLDRVGRILTNTIGTAAVSMAGVLSYTKIASVPELATVGNK